MSFPDADTNEAEGDRSQAGQALQNHRALLDKLGCIKQAARKPTASAFLIIFPYKSSIR
jgi:hypothetical protein